MHLLHGAGVVKVQAEIARNFQPTRLRGGDLAEVARQHAADAEGGEPAQ